MLNTLTETNIEYSHDQWNYWLKVRVGLIKTLENNNTPAHRVRTHCGAMMFSIRIVL